MKRFFLIFMSIFTMTTFSFGQKEKYPSKEEKEYNKNSKNNYAPFKPLDKNIILNFQSEYYEINETKSNYEPYSPDNFSTPYGKYFKQYLDSILKTMSRDEFMKHEFEDVERIGKIGKDQILKHEKNDSIEAFIYESPQYENFFFGETGIWIGYSENNGKDWSYYYTGIVQKQPVFVKYYSQRPLIIEKGKLEIDACLLRQLSPFAHPVPPPSYECVKDGIYLVFDMNTIARDSDGDGLTDIVEDKFYTDKYNKDTDGDGIPDNSDTNPRVFYPRTEISKIYEAIIDNDIEWNKEGVISGTLIFKDDIIYATDSTETILIVTDNKDLMGIQPRKHRIIFMTPDEYQKKGKTFNTDLNRMSISPLFKVDNMENTFKMTESINTGGRSWIIRKTENNWVVEIISMWIS